VSTRNCFQQVLSEILKYSFLLIVIFITLVPFLWIVLSSMKTNQDIFGSPMSLPKKLTLMSYKLAFELAPITKYYLNSIVVTSVTTLTTILLTTMSGYVLSRFNFKLKNAIVIVFTSAILIPYFSLAQPLFYILNKINLIDTKSGLILVYSAFGLPVRLWIIRSYFLTIPKEIEESAYLDGATYTRTFIKIMLPLAKPGIATAATITFIDTWKEFFFALLLTSSDKARTLPVSLNYFVHFFSYNYSTMFAAMVVVTIPTIIFFILMQEQVVKSLASGAVKG